MDEIDELLSRMTPRGVGRALLDLQAGAERERKFTWNLIRKLNAEKKRLKKRIKELTLIAKSS